MRLEINNKPLKAVLIPGTARSLTPNVLHLLSNAEVSTLIINYTRSQFNFMLIKLILHRISHVLTSLSNEYVCFGTIYLAVALHTTMLCHIAPPKTRLCRAN